MKFHAVLWDMDGVLIDSEPFYNRAEAVMMSELGLPFGEDEIRRFTGASYKNIAALMPPVRPPEEIRRMYNDMLLSSVQNVSALIGGLPEVLEALKTLGVKQAIGSSSPRPVVDYAVNRFNLARYMSAVVCGNDAEDGKPAPGIYLLCAERLGVDPRDCLVVEDSVNGVLAGKNAGMTVAAFLGTSVHGFDLSAADFSFDNYGEFLDKAGFK